MCSMDITQRTTNCLLAGNNQRMLLRVNGPRGGTDDCSDGGGSFIQFDREVGKNLNKISSVVTANACATGETGKMMR